ncbi:MAG: hypothetical protein WBW06_12825 [Xanthobacteraceae bacterium]
MKRTLRWALALVKRNATGGPLPSPKAYVLPAAVVTVRDPLRMNRRKNVANNQSKLASPRTSYADSAELKVRARREAPRAPACRH